MKLEDLSAVQTILNEINNNRLIIQIDELKALGVEL